MKKALFLFTTLISLSLLADDSVVSDHFVCEGTTDENLISFAEENFIRIARNLSIEIEEPLLLKVYPDIESFHSEKGNGNSSDFYICTRRGDEIHVVSPDNPGPIHTESSVKRALAGSISKILLKQAVDSQVPVWVLDGFAFYETSMIPEGKKMTGIYNWRLKILSKEYGVFPFVEELLHRPTFAAAERQGQSMEARKSVIESNALYFSFIRFYIENWGYESFIRLCNSNLDLEHEIKMDQDRVAAIWYEAELERMNGDQ